MKSRSNRFLHGVLALTVAALCACAAAAQLKPQQFEVGWPLDVPGDQKIFDVPLTPEVYRHAASANQVAVLDAAGNAMSFYRVVPPPASATEQRVALTPSPLYSQEAPDAIAQLSVATADRQTNVTVTRGAEEPGKQIVAFVVDARDVAARPVALELNWRPQAEPFLLEVRIEQSRTLTDWQLVGRASVAQLRIGGADVLHERVPVSASTGGYFRVTWADTVPQWYLAGVTVVSSTIARAQPEVASVGPLADVPRQSTQREPRPPANALYFDAGAILPVSSVTLDFTGGNGWASGSIATASALEGPWDTVAYGPLFYELDYQGQGFVSDPLVLGRREARYWRVTTAEPLARERVALRLEYPAETLRVSAEGRAPYLLVAGTFAKEAGPDATFAAVWSAMPAPAAPARAALGESRVLGGATALQAPYVFPWRVTLLWLILSGGALAVGWMAVRLARELGKPQS